jgi:hypothetical protein
VELIPSRRHTPWRRTTSGRHTSRRHTPWRRTTSRRHTPWRRTTSGGHTSGRHTPWRRTTSGGHTTSRRPSRRTTTGTYMTYDLRHDIYYLKNLKFCMSIFIRIYPIRFFNSVVSLASFVLHGNFSTI